MKKQGRKKARTAVVDNVIRDDDVVAFFVVAARLSLMLRKAKFADRAIKRRNRSR